VMRFFLVSIAFTIGWMTVSSLLDHYKLQYGPAILLQMNLAYFLPSIPLLLISSCLDDVLDRKYGIAKTTLMRLLIGLGGCAAVTAVWPFAHRSHRTLLSLVVVLGLVAGIAFSASYQLVARFANKNTISLGLGCVGSGIVTLIVETALRMGSTPSHKQELILFEATAGVIVLGALAAFSLLIRHWNSIEGSTARVADAGAAESLLAEEGSVRPAGALQDRSIRKSLSLMLKYSPLSPFETMSDPERIDVDDEEALVAIRELFSRPSLTKGRSQEIAPSPDPSHTSYSEDDNGAARASSMQRGISALQATLEEFPDPESHDHVGILGLCRLIWPIMMALFLAGVILCLVFPFFTYVPSSGMLGDQLPKVLFFVRLFADMTGRTLPRKKALALTSQRLLFGLSCVVAVTVPLFFLYLKSPPRFHSDWLSIAFVVFTWGNLGYINTCSYMLAPQRVPTSAKGTANGALAIIYQTSHCLGLLLALGLAIAMFGTID